MNPIKHVAIIMDGNGRWGLKRNKTRNYGHNEGLKIVEKIIFFSIKKKISYLTLFVFSTENWRRPKYEVKFLFKLLESYFKKKLSAIVNKGIRIKIIGNKTKFSYKLRNIIKKTEVSTKKNRKILVNLALNYGSRDELIQAIKQIVKKKIKITKKNLTLNMYMPNIPEPNLLIRTGGKKRLSNFLLWQVAYTELFFLDKLWPDFSTNDYAKILNKYNKIKRNFGSI